MPTATDHAAFLAAIRRDPSDEQARLVFADWLDERGDPDGEIVRLLCEVQRPAMCETCNGKGRVRIDGMDGVYRCLLCGGSGRKSKACPECYGEGKHWRGPSMNIPVKCDSCNHGAIPSDAYQPGPAYERLEAVTGGLDAVIEQLSERDRCLFACDCAERVLPLFERWFEADDRPRCAVTARRMLVAGEATEGDYDNANHDAWIAALETRHWAAFAAARDDLPKTAASDARSAVKQAEGDPAAERRWQLCRAVEYRLNFISTESENER